MRILTVLVAAYQKALVSADSAIEVYQSAIDTLPQLGLAYNVKGDALFEIGDYKQALNCYINAKNILITYYGETHAAVAQVYNNIGRYHMASEAIYLAAEHYQKALKIRIELRQISVRDRTAAIGAIGVCGLQTCCED